MDDMEYKTRVRIWVAGIGMLMWVLSCWLFYDMGYRHGVADAGTETDTVVRVVTSRYIEPAPIKERQVGTISIPVRVEMRAPAEPEGIPDGEIVVIPPTEFSRDLTDTLAEMPDTALKPSWRAVVPLTQKEYRDSNFTAYVSGFMPRLDSIEVYNKTVTIAKTVTKRSLFSVGITGGIGYGVFTKKPDVWVGVGVTWDLFSR